MFNSRIIKGGALLEDSKRLVEAWDPDLGVADNLQRLRASGWFGRSTSRQEDLLGPLRRRFLAPGPGVLRGLKSLAGDPRAFREACYYEAARSDEVLAAFAAGPLYERYWRDGNAQVTVGDVVAWLRDEPRAPAWGEYTRKRVARGLLSTLRDFGILEGPRGGRRKRIRPPHLSMRGFAYVALRERERLASARALMASEAWRWYLLDPEGVRRLFLQADRQGVLRFHEAGSVLRVDWVLTDLSEVSRVPAA